MTSRADSTTDQKLSTSSFDWLSNQLLTMSPARDMSDLSWIRSYRKLVMSSDTDLATDQKISTSSFDWLSNQRMRTSPARDMSDFRFSSRLRFHVFCSIIQKHVVFIGYLDVGPPFKNPLFYRVWRPRLVYYFATRVYYVRG